MTRSIKYLLLLTILSFSLLGQEVAVPFESINMPAHDLIYQGEIISPEKAFKLQRNQDIDLSTLSAKTNSIWNPEILQTIEYDNRLKIENNEAVEFRDTILSIDGMLRFNVNHSNGKIITVYMDTLMHVAHLRKNLLRKLGYQIPAIKRLKNLTVNYKTKGHKKSFLKKMRWRVDADSARKWVISGTEDIDEENTDEDMEPTIPLKLRDISVIESGKDTIYNSAMAVPPKYQRSRSLRAILLPYALCDLPESINQLTWHVGRISENKLILPYFFKNANFKSVTMDDLRWMGKRLVQLTPNDFKQIVLEAHYPEPVASILIEKLLSRRKSLLKILGIELETHSKLATKTKLTIPPHLKKGIITKKDWTDFGYATDFSSTVAPSPFKDLHYFFLSMLQSVALDSLVSKVNKELKAFDIAKPRLALAKKEFIQGLDHYVQTGELLQFPISTWFSPIANGNIILSRDIVIGNYLGTDNLVQLADTFGFAANIGLHIGYENIPKVRGTHIRATTTFTKTFTHLKPLKTLKNVFKEPYQNMIVPLLKMDLRKHLKNVKKAEEGYNRKIGKDEDKDDFEENRAGILKDLLGVITKNLGVGESLLITEKWSKDASGGARIPVITPLTGPGLTVALGASAGHVTVKRFQVLRKDATTLQIFDDRGNSIYGAYNIDLSSYIPILKIRKRYNKGKYVVQYKNINIDADLSSNPDFFDNLELFNSILKKNNMKHLTAAEKSGKVIGRFYDTLNSGAFLIWRRKRLRSFTKYQAEVNKLGLKGVYVSFRDHIQTGKNWESLLKEVTLYFLHKKSQDVQWANQIWKKPSDTVGGMSKTLEADYEAILEGDQTTRDYISVTERAEGWGKKHKKLTKFAQKLNEKHGLELFTKEMFEQIKKLSLYDAFTKVNIYERGINNFKNLGVDYFIRYAYHHEKDRVQSCSNRYTRKISNGREIPTCGYLGTIIDNYRNCQKGKKKLKKNLQCWLRLVKRVYKKFDIHEFATFFGKNNIYLYAQINGFRKDSEIFREPIQSHGYGRKDPRNPDGIISLLKRKLDIPNGEIEGHWMRDRL